MAFSPMHAFRKHQKVIFAGLAVLCMFVFILQFGRGDLFEQIMANIGGTSRDPELATLYGKDLHRAEFFQIQDRRQLANRFILYAIMSSHQEVFRELSDPKLGVPAWDVPEKSTVQQQLFFWPLLYTFPLPADPEKRQEFLQRVQGDAQKAFQELGFVAQQLDQKNKKREAEQVQALIRNIGEQLRFLGRIRTPGQLYFGGTTSPQDIFDFLIWQHQADRLGIRLTPKDAGSLLARLTNGNNYIFLGSHEGKAIRFYEDQVRPMGRPARGVRAMDLEEGDYLVGAEVVDKEGLILSISEQGYGKRTGLDEYRLTARGGKGVINMKTTSRTGKVVAILAVREESDLIIVTKEGKIIRIESAAIRQAGRSTQGVRLVRTDDGDSVAAASVVPGEDETNGNGEQGSLPLQ